MKRPGLLLLLVLLAMPGLVAGQKAATKPPPKPPAAQAPKPAYDPVIDLAVRVNGSLKVIFSEMSALRAHYKSSVVGKGYGTWDFPVQQYDKGRYRDIVPATLGEEGDAEATVKKALQSMKENEAAWKAKQMSTVRYASSLYGYLTTSVEALWQLSTPVDEVKVLQAELQHAIDGKRDTLTKDPRFASTGDRRVDAQRLTGFLDAIDAAKSELWSEYVERVRSLRQRVDKTRKKWGRELWMYYDFAEAKTASPNDGHAAGKNTVKSSLEYTFTSRTRPIVFDSARNNGLFLDTKSISLKDKDAQGGSVVAFEAISSFTEPDLQVFINAPSFLSVNMCLEPPVEKLRGYSEPAEPPAITDAFLLPKIGPGGIPQKGRIQFEIVDGSETCYIFVYGPKLPTRRAQLKALKGPAHGILYEPVAFIEDAKTATGQVKHLWEQGVFMLTRGVAEPNAQDLRAMPAMVVRAKLAPGVLPGLHTFSINGAGAAWTLDQGTCRAEMSFIRELKDPDLPMTPGEKVNTEPISAAFKGESVRVQIKTVIPVDIKEFGIVLGKNGAWVTPDGKPTIKAKLVPGEQSTYRTDPIYILDEGDDRLDPNAKNSGREPGAVYLGAWVSDHIEATLEDQRMFVLSQPGTALTVSPDPPMSLWYDALSRAAKAAGLHGNIQNWRTLPNKTAKEVEMTPITEVILRPWVLIQRLYKVDALQKITLKNRITLGDHAAMLMLKDEFVRQMAKVKSELDTIDTPEKQIAFLDALGPAIDQLPLGVIEVDRIDPKNFPGTDLGGGVPTEKLATYYKHPERFTQLERDVPGSIRYAKLMGYRLYKEAVDTALNKAKHLEDKNIDGLLEIIGSRPQNQGDIDAHVVGNGFNAVATDLVPRLMRPIKLPSGAYRWVPDFSARAAVNGLNNAIEAVRAQNDYETADRQVVIAAASLAPFFLAGTLKTVISLVINVISLADMATTIMPEMKRQDAEVKFALGASSVLGAERFYVADLQRTPTWALALNILGSACAAGATAVETFVVLSKLTKHVAMPLAKLLASKVNKYGLAAFSKAPAEEQAALIAVGGSLDARKAARGPLSVFKDEEEIQQAIKILAEEQAKKPPLAKTARAPELELPNPERFVNPVEDNPFGKTAPTKPCDWSGGDGTLFYLGDKLGKKTQFFNVFRRQSQIQGANGATRQAMNQVIKVIKVFGEEAKSTMQGVRKAMETLVKKNIPHKKILKIYEGEQRSYVIQELLEENLVTPGKRVFQVQSWLDNKGGLTDEMENAIIAFVKKLRDEKICYEDFKFDNIYLEELPKGADGKERWICGVLDVDRIAPWGDFTDDLNYFATRWETNPAGNRINSAIPPGRDFGNAVTTKRAIESVDEYWHLVLERMYMIHFQPGGGFASGALSIDKLEKIFPGLKGRGYIEFYRRTWRDIPKPPLMAWLRAGWATLGQPRIAFG